MEMRVFATADVSDAVDGNIAMASRIRPMWRGARLAGTAFTVRTLPGQHLAVRRALELAQEGDVLVIDGAGDLTHALWGDRMSLLALERGLAGVVVDGAVRDIEAIEALGFPVFAVATVPSAPHAELEGEVGVPIACGDVAVVPGDVVVADADGVVVLPNAVSGDVLDRLAKVSSPS
jgi:RraA family protein